MSFPHATTPGGTPSPRPPSYPAPRYPAPARPAPEYSAPGYPAPAHPASAHPAPSRPVRTPRYLAPGYPAPAQRIPAEPAPVPPPPGRPSAGPSPATRRRLVPQVLALLLLLGGVAGYLGGTTAVRLVDDGAARTVRTYASTVKGLLHHTGVSLGAHDVITPAPDRAIHTGDEVLIERGRPVILTLDGVTKKQWLTARTVEELISNLKLGDANLRVSAGPGTRIPRDGMRITIRTEKRLTLVADGKKTQLTSYAATPAELFAEQGLQLKGRDESKPPIDASLAGATQVRLIRVTVKPKRETVELEPPVTVKKNPDWMRDQKQVIKSGSSGEADQQVEYIYRDGKLSERKVLSSETLVEPKPRVVRKGTRAYPPDDTGLNWDALAECESGGNPRSVSANGTYHGLYQFSVSTWQRTGGIGLPSEATPREQTYRAILLYKRAGADQWPHCGPRLFT